MFSGRHPPQRSSPSTFCHFTVLPPRRTPWRLMAKDKITYRPRQPNFTYNLEGATLRDARRQPGSRQQRRPRYAGQENTAFSWRFGSDNLPIGPMVGLYAAVTRKGRERQSVTGPGEGGAVESRKLSRCIRATGAFLTREERQIRRDAPRRESSRTNDRVAGRPAERFTRQDLE